MEPASPALEAQNPHDWNTGEVHNCWYFFGVLNTMPLTSSRQAQLPWHQALLVSPGKTAEVQGGGRGVVPLQDPPAHLPAHLPRSMAPNWRASLFRAGSYFPEQLTGYWGNRVAADCHVLSTCCMPCTVLGVHLMGPSHNSLWRGVLSTLR